MKKANIKANNQYYEGFILIENMTDLFLHYTEVTMGLTKEAAREIVDRSLGRGDNKEPHSITKLSEFITSRNGKGAIWNEACVMSKYQGDLEDQILNGYRIAINPYNKVSYFTLSSDAEVQIITEKVKYTKEDIKLSRFPDGRHWYAKVGLIDVVIDGDVKWNARFIAQEKAEKFLMTL